MTTPREPLAGKVASPLRSGVLWGLMALIATGILALLIGAGGAATTWVLERLDRMEFGWPGDLVFAAGVVGTALSIPAASWSVSYASTQRAPAGRALLAAGLGIGALVAVSAIDRSVALMAGGSIAFAVSLPYAQWHRLTLRLAPPVIAIIVGAALIGPTGNVATIVLTALSYPVAALLVWAGDGLWRVLASRGSRGVT